MAACNHSETAVPLGGTRIPEGMEKHADWKSLPVVTDTPKVQLEPAALGKFHDEVVKARLHLQKAKKSITTLMQDVKPVLLAIEKGDAKEEQSSEEKMKKSSQELEESCKDIAASVRDALVYLENEEAKNCLANSRQSIEENLNNASEAAMKTFQECNELVKDGLGKVREGIEVKETYGDIILKTNKISSALFSHQNKLMDVIKTIKKACQ